MAMTVKKDNNEVRIQWRVADIKIPTSEIKNISQDQEIHAVPDLDSKIFHVLVLLLVKLIEWLLIQIYHEYIIYTHNDQKVYNELTK